MLWHHTNGASKLFSINDFYSCLSGFLHTLRPGICITVHAEEMWIPKIDFIWERRGKIRLFGVILEVELHYLEVHKVCHLYCWNTFQQHLKIGVRRMLTICVCFAILLDLWNSYLNYFIVFCDFCCFSGTLLSLITFPGHQHSFSSVLFPAQQVWNTDSWHPGVSKLGVSEPH